MQKGIRCRLYPNRIQKQQIAQTFGCCRLIYNMGLAYRKESFAAGRRVGYKDTCAFLTTLKQQPEYAFLKEPAAVALQQSLRDLDRAYQNFFAHRARYPKFKKKRNHRHSYRTINQNNGIRIIGKHIKLPKLGLVKFKQSMPIGRINNVTIEQVPSGKYYAVVNVEFTPEQRENAGGVIGIDVGIKDFYTDSNGNTVANPRFLEQSLRKQRREQRRLSRKRIGSKNWNKQRLRVARINEKVASQRNDFLQKQSTMLIRENQTICIEDLNIAGMKRNHKLARAISSASWSKFFSMLEYKAAWYGNDVIRVPTLYPSSQTCSCCGYRNPLIKNLAIRTWECPQCHAVHDRDHNASINILNKGLSVA